MISQPINITGVKIYNPSTGQSSGTLRFRNSDKALAWNDGDYFETASEGFNYLLTDTSGNNVSIDYEGAELPSADQTDAITITAETMYWVGGTGLFNDVGKWSLTSGGTPTATLPCYGDSVVFDSNSFTATGQSWWTYIGTLQCKNFTISGVLNNPEIGGSVYVAGGGAVNIDGSSNGAPGFVVNGTYDFNLGEGGIGYLVIGTDSTPSFTGSVNLLSDLFCGEIYVYAGSTLVDATKSGGANINATYFYVHGTLTLQDGTYIYLYNDFYSANFYADDTATINAPAESTIECGSFDGGGHTYGNVYIDDEGSYSYISGNNTFDYLELSCCRAYTGTPYLFQFASGSTQTISSEFWTYSEYGQPINIDSSDGVTAWNVVAGTTNIILSGGTLYNSHASGGVFTFRGYDGGGNTGWDIISNAVEVSEALSLVDSQDLSWTIGGVNYYDKLIGEFLNAVDANSSLGSLMNSCLENLGIQDISASALACRFTLAESIFFYETQKIGWKLSVSDTIALTDSVYKVLGLMISDWLTLTDKQKNNWSGREVVPDTLNLFDISGLSKIYANTINESLQIADASKYMLTILVLEHLGFNDLAAAMLSIGLEAKESLIVSDSAYHGFSKTITDVLSMVDATTVAALFMKTIQEALGITDTAISKNYISKEIDESIVLVETVASNGQLYSAIYETLILSDDVELDGDVYECYALNTPSFHPSMYSGFDFNSYCVFENRAFGARSDGIYELTGSTDAGNEIHTGAILSETDWGMPNQKRFRRGYLGISGTQPVIVMEAEDGERLVYNIDAQGKFVASHDLKSKKWVLSIADFDTLDHVKLIPVILTK